ncbi:hypothetical protein [Actinoalloteichus sp. GBA129-24]|uniref:hypothetical protein n=1 Tax=Actinoalloteichus sp. GBA129-24 TaxID=1612551 RepID=UPI0012FACF7B|nr:hypothetical protein [Actinoalloteichus sp. GBA129-24]
MSHHIACALIFFIVFFHFIIMAIETKGYGINKSFFGLRRSNGNDRLRHRLIGSLRLDCHRHLGRLIPGLNGIHSKRRGRIPELVRSSTMIQFPGDSHR